MSGFGPRCAVCTILAALVFLSALGGQRKCADPAGLLTVPAIRIGDCQAWSEDDSVNYVKVNHDPRVSLRVVLGQDEERN